MPVRHPLGVRKYSMLDFMEVGASEPAEIKDEITREVGSVAEARQGAKE
ncbi:hypothetical protein X759_03570 [Mesorhizobium sp. LSHC420B00]|nr:hypothetical protein X759_03570 [Mesorhizobium sp. LSHC420B00]